LFFAAAAVGGDDVLADTAADDRRGGVLAFVEQLRVSTVARVDDRLYWWPVEETVTPSHVEWRAIWCPRGEGSAGSLEVALAVGRYCRDQGGDLGLNIGCLRPRADTEDLLFIARMYGAGPRYRCPGKISPIDVWILEPVPGKERSPGFLAAAARLGFELPEVQRRRMAAGAGASYGRESLTVRGTKICRAERGFVYVGFVDDVNPVNGKIRIQVSGTTTGVAPGGFAPGPIWDAPENWQVCESRGAPTDLQR
jgi:hypothetical protein